MDDSESIAMPKVEDADMFGLSDLRTLVEEIYRQTWDDFSRLEMEYCTNVLRSLSSPGTGSPSVSSSIPPPVPRVEEEEDASTVHQEFIMDTIANHSDDDDIDVDMELALAAGLASSDSDSDSDSPFSLPPSQPTASSNSNTFHSASEGSASTPSMVDIDEALSRPAAPFPRSGPSLSSDSESTIKGKEKVEATVTTPTLCPSEAMAKATIPSSVTTIDMNMDVDVDTSTVLVHSASSRKFSLPQLDR
jgi:hypothetical protein